MITGDFANRYTVDRFEGGFAVCLNEENVQREVPLLLLPEEVREGDVLEIRFGSRVGRYRIQSVKETVRKEGAQDMYEVLEEDEQTRMERGEA